MKATLLFATTLTMLLVSSGAKGMSELEELRARCNAQEQQIQSLEKRLRSSPGSATATETASSTVANSSGTHVVKAGESLDRIARQNGCSVEQLAQANGLRATSIIQPGQKLTLPGATSLASVASAEKPPLSSQPKASVSKYAGKTHKVRQGETYYSISKKYKMSIPSLMAANPKVKATALRPGLVLKLSKDSAPAPASPAPASTPVVAAKTPYPEAKSAPAPKASAPQPKTEPKHNSSTVPVIAEAPRGLRKTDAKPAAPQPAANSITETKAPASSPAPAAAAPAAQSKNEPQPASQASPSQNPEKKVRSVTVDNEMTYGDFAANHGTDTSRLNDLNGLDLTHATVLAKGSELYVPAQP